MKSYNITFWVRGGACMLCLLPGMLFAQNTDRWYQVELTVFQQRNSSLVEENWQDGSAAFTLPGNAQPLTTLMDVLDLEDWDSVFENTSRGDGGEPRQQSDFRLPDVTRDPFVALPAADHAFLDSNRALENSANYRLLYHSAWRQPVYQAARATPLRIQGGFSVDDLSELDGTVTIRFNRGEDRVVIDTDLWFNVLSGDTVVQQIPVRATRDMRSNEFHYLDHPVIGVLVQVSPYSPPPAAQPFQIQQGD